MSSELILLEPLPAWSPAAHRATWGERDVVALLGPQVDGAFVRSKERSAAHVGRERAGSLPLLGVVEHDGRAAWLYPGTEGITLGCVIDGELPPLRVAAELLAAVAERLVDLGPEGLTHPGPGPNDVLVLPSGEVFLLGFVGPTLPDPGRRPPQSTTPADALVYRLGVLLSELLTGGTPPANTGPDAHESMVRRVLIRIMSRPGPVFPERYRDWVQGMLAYAPDDRPVLSRLAPSLRALVADLPEADLPTWAASEVPRRRHAAVPSPRRPLRTTDQVDVTDVRQDATTQGLDTSDLVDTGETRESTYRRPQMDTVSSDQLSLDDVTAVSVGGEEPPLSHAPRPEVGAIPVMVGPPVEVARKRPRLPADLFSEEDPAESRRRVPVPPGPPELTPTAAPTHLPSGRTLAIVAAVLCLLTLVLSAYLFG